MAIVWFVLSSLSACGLRYLRATDTIGDGVFQPLARVLCREGDRIETSYVQTMSRVTDRGARAVLAPGRQVHSFELGTATCVSSDGGAHPAFSFLAAVWSVPALVFGALCLVGWRRRKR